MKRNLPAMAGTAHDLLVIGGGIMGAAIAWDAALRGLSVALVERRDFSSGTSAGSSRLVHGGLRYLKNFELGLVRESLRERRIWEIIAPHQVGPLAFMVPAGTASQRLTLEAGLTLYDLLSYDRNRLDDPDKRLPGYKYVSCRAAADEEPVVDGMGSVLRYYDCQMLSPERIGLEMVRGAAERGAHVANYASADAFLQEHGRILGACIRDGLDGSAHEVRARVTVNAAGPWADYLLGLAQAEPSRHLIRSKGIHLVTRPIVRRHALTLPVPKPMGGGHLFILPWRDVTIIGTTDTVFDKNPDDLDVTDEDIASLLGLTNACLPEAHLSRADVRHAYAGLRPLIDDGGGGGSYNASRKSEVVDHGAEDGLHGLLSAIGGKWTTARHVAETVVDRVARLLETPARACETASTPLPAGNIGRFTAFQANARARFPDIAPGRLRWLAEDMGARLDDLMTLADGDDTPLAPGRPELMAQADYAVAHEMAVSLEDIVFRRTTLGLAGHPGADALTAIARRIAPALGWDDTEIHAQVKKSERLFHAGLTP